MTTNINTYTVVYNGINGTTTAPLLNIYSDIFTYKDTSANNLPNISSIPFTAETMNGIATVDPSGGITLLNPGIYKIDMEVIVSESSYNDGQNQYFNTMLTTAYFDGSTNTWSYAVPLLYYNVNSTTTPIPPLTITSVDAPGVAYVTVSGTSENVYFNGLTLDLSNGPDLPGNPFINVQYKTNNQYKAYFNFLSIHYIINSTTGNQTIYFTTQAPNSGSSTLYMGLVTAVVNLTSTNSISL